MGKTGCHLFIDFHVFVEVSKVPFLEFHLMVYPIQETSQFSICHIRCRMSDSGNNGSRCCMGYNIVYFHIVISETCYSTLVLILAGKFLFEPDSFPADLKIFHSEVFVPAIGTTHHKEGMAFYFVNIASLKPKNILPNSSNQGAKVQFLWISS